MRTASPPAPSGRTAQQIRDGLPSTRPPAIWPSGLAAACLILIALLACAPGVRVQGGDSVTLLFLALAGIVAFYSPLRRVFFPADPSDEPRARNASTFALLCAMSVLFPLARRYAPLESLSLRAPGIEEPFPLSVALLVAVAGALVTLPATWRVCSGVVRASGVAIAILTGFGLSGFWLLGQFYKVGATETVDPTFLAQLLIQLVEWGALVLLCHAASAQARVRRALLSALPILLLLVWARHHFIAPPPEDE